MYQHTQHPEQYRQHGGECAIFNQVSHLSEYQPYHITHFDAVIRSL